MSLPCSPTTSATLNRASRDGVYLQLVRRRSCAFNATIIVLADIRTAGSPGRYGLSRSLWMVVSMMRGRASVRTMMRMMSVVVSGHLCVRVGFRASCHDAGP